jgi:hypothetical protein
MARRAAEGRSYIYGTWLLLGTVLAVLAIARVLFPVSVFVLAVQYSLASTPTPPHPTSERCFRVSLTDWLVRVVVAGCGGGARVSCTCAATRRPAPTHLLVCSCSAAPSAVWWLQLRSPSLRWRLFRRPRGARVNLWYIGVMERW